MPDPENASRSASGESMRGDYVALPTLQDDLRDLRLLLIVAALALVLLSLSFNAFLYSQDRVVRRELDAAKKMQQEFETAKQPMLNTFISRLQDFARTNPDINPILDKYGIRPVDLAPAPSSGPAPAKNGK
jgi:hypothetical protein